MERQMSGPLQFDDIFDALTGNSPFPWQRELYRRFIAGDFPESCNLPTGLGKTSVIPIWMIALSVNPAGVPRRLAYVVNRRTVVDQATREAEQMRNALAVNPELHAVTDTLRLLAARSSDVPLAISTLRGQFADNAEWRDDPARPGVIVGTVDMIGSRLLFSGYGRGFKSRPLHAGFLGQDTLLVHDEAHLEPAFQELITAIESEQQRCGEFRRFRVMALSATSRGDGGEFGLTDADMEDDEVRRRIKAKKGISFHPVDDEKGTADKVAELAQEHKASGQAILVFLRKLEDVEKVADKLDKGNPHKVQRLTGTLRGLERDALAKDDVIFARFMPKPAVTPQQGTVYLICTSAGEVGVNISADHMICDLTPFDSMAQRLGRVNRFGDGAARIDIVHPMTFDEKDKLCEARQKTLELLRKLPHKEDGHDASPATLGDLPVADRQAAFTPPPVILPTSDILFDAWALTSIRQKLPGRPPVADWLHGVAEWEPAETRVAWREEVERLTGELLEKYKPEDLLEDYPLKPHELLRDRTVRVFDHLETMAARCPELSAWLIESDGAVRVLSLHELVAKDRQKKPVVSLADCTVVLSPAVGSLKKGMLNGGADFDEAQRQSYDVSDQWRDENETRRRCRVWDNDEPPKGMRLVRTIDTRPDAEDELDEGQQTSRRRYWRWYVQPRSADDDGSRAAMEPQKLQPHLSSAERFANALVAKLVSGPEAAAVVLAAKRHDIGKDRAIWQRSIGNRDYPEQVLAKSGGKVRPIEITGYRHEFGSLIDVARDPEFRRLTFEVQDLVLHLIAAHHGRARPHFPTDEVFDPKHSEDDSAVTAREVPRRFARLQRRYGRWGLAYIESLVRAADVLASQEVTR
jgi:CRISPR-associated endonuclease/helicase Cas3